MSESPVWRSIDAEPAPDWTEVIVYAPDADPSIFTAIISGGTWGRSSGKISAVEDDFFGDDPFRVTHWMPLPDNPE